MNNLTCASFFTGVGGIDIAFESEGFKTIFANEIDENATRTFENNSKISMHLKDINYVSEDEIPKFEIMLAGFPCQAFSLAGDRKGFDDEKGRGILFFELERIIKSKKPKVIFLENVKNLVSHNNGNTFRVILQKLEDCGYYVKYQVLNATTHGNIPQNRERIYIVAFKNKKHYQHFEFPKPIALTKKIYDIIDFENVVDEYFYYRPEKCTFYNQLENEVINNETIYQWRRVYVRENENNVCPTLTANMGTGGHNVPLIKTKHGIRKLTPRECFALQGFPENFQIPTNVSFTQAYKQAGNSVVIPVVSKIAEQIKKSLLSTY